MKVVVVIIVITVVSNEVVMRSLDLSRGRGAREGRAEGETEQTRW